MKKHFTLVDLIVVCCVTLVLAMLLISAAKPDRTMAMKIQCQSNEKKLAIATAMYCEESNGHLPRPGSGPNLPEAIYWTNQLGKYLGVPGAYQPEIGWFTAEQEIPVFRCPASEDNHLAGTPYAGKQGLNYGSNAELTITVSTEARNMGWGMRLEALRDPSSIIGLYEGRHGGAYGSYQRGHYNHGCTGAAPIPGCTDWKAPAKVPDGLCMNILWADGHVSEVTEVIHCNYRDTTSPWYSRWVPNP